MHPAQLRRIRLDREAGRTPTDLRHGIAENPNGAIPVTYQQRRIPTNPYPARQAFRKPPREKHAVYAVVGPDLAFRVGQPTDWNTAQARHERLSGGVVLWPGRRVRANRRWYPVKCYEVRAVDRHGRGLGSPRHSTAIPVPYRSDRPAR